MHAARGAVRTGTEGSQFIHWGERTHEELGTHATDRSALRFIFIRGKKRARQRKAGK